MFVTLTSNEEQNVRAREFEVGVKMWLHDIRTAIFHEACSIYDAHLPWCHSQHGTESEFFEFIIRQDERLGSFDWALWLHDSKYSLLLNEHVIFDSRDTSCDTVINKWSSAPQQQGLSPHSGHDRGAGWVTRYLRPHTLRRCYMLTITQLQWTYFATYLHA